MARSRSLVLALLAALVVPVALASPAAATAYRYWGYFQLKAGAWAFAQTGPDQSKPADGAVEGWRFAVGTESDTREPRATPTFDDLCGTTPGAAGKKRVGVVIDYGRPADAAETGTTPPQPRGACASVDTAATGADALAAVATVRVANGLTCALDGYPATGCGDTVAKVPAAAAAPDSPVTLVVAGAEATASATTQPASDAADDGGGPSAAVWITLGVVAVAVAGGAMVAQRRRSSVGAD